MRTLMLLVFAFTALAYSQKKPDKLSEASPEQKQMDQFFEMRKEMLKRMHESFMADSMNDDFFNGAMESFFESDMSNSGFTDKIVTKNFSSNWEENDQERILVLKPQNKDTPLDIKIKDKMISIQSKDEKKEQAGSMRSSFTSSFSLPPDVDENKAEITQRGEEILVRLPKKKVSGENKVITSPKKVEQPDGFEPIKPGQGDITI